jgi:hypothetical protein
VRRGGLAASALALALDPATRPSRSILGLDPNFPVWTGRPRAPRWTKRAGAWFERISHSQRYVADDRKGWHGHRRREEVR